MNNLEPADENAVAQTWAGYVESFARSPIRLLMPLIPGAPVVEVGIFTLLAIYQHQRMQKFGDTLITLGLSEVTAEDLKKKEFFDAYTATVKCVLNESREKKIELFARLFGAYVQGGCSLPMDRYEEHLLTLDMLSEREFRLLQLLHRHEMQNPINQGENRVQSSSRFWSDFQQDAERELGIGKEDLPAVLGRISRTGMYLEITATVYDYDGGQGYLTTEFQQFLAALGISQPPQSEA